MRLSMRVWDAPIRLFHWIIVLLIIVSYLTARAGNMRLHFLSGYSMLALLLFRVVWGFVGSDTARFRNFLTNPAKGLVHLAQFGRREVDNQVGHNAAGGWMVLVLLLDLAVQVGLGLFATDDIASDGPLAKFVEDDTSERLTHFHTVHFFYVLLPLIALHVLAVIAYAAVKRHNLLRPMITGKKRMPAAMRPPRMASPMLALLVLACAAGAVALFATNF